MMVHTEPNLTGLLCKFEIGFSSCLKPFGKKKSISSLFKFPPLYLISQISQAECHSIQLTTGDEPSWSITDPFLSVVRTLTEVSYEIQIF